MQMLLAKTNMQSKLKFIRLVLRFLGKNKTSVETISLIWKTPICKNQCTCYWSIQTCNQNKG